MWLKSWTSLSVMTVLVGVVSGILALGHTQQRQPDVPYVPTPHEVVAEMLKMANVGKGDIVYDLGCGDGRIVIAAVKDFGAKRGVGVDIDPQRIRESNENAQKAGVTDRVKFLQQDLFKMDISEATVVTLYLLPSVNLWLRPKLFRELKPGVRIVSHDFDMDEWQADKVARVRGPYREHTVYYWVLPAGVGGTWRWSVSTPRGERHYVLRLKQQFQKFNGIVSTDGQETPVTNAKLVGDQLSFTITREIGGQKVTMNFSGQVNGDTIRGSVDVQGGPFAGKRKWTAKRDKVNLLGTWRWKDGALRIEQRNGRLFATYLARDREIPTLDIDHRSNFDFYAFGASVYFTIGDGAKQTYEGSLEGDRIVGTVERNGTKTSWVAQRSKE